MPVSGRFRFILRSKPDRQKTFRVTANVFVQAFVSTRSGAKGAVEFFIGFDDKKKNRRGPIRGFFDPTSFPPFQPLTFFEQVDFEVDRLTGFHQFSIEPGKSSAFTKETIFDIHMEIIEVK